MPIPQARELSTREREHLWFCCSCFVFLCFLSVVDAFVRLCGSILAYASVSICWDKKMFRMKALERNDTHILYRRQVYFGNS